MLSNFGSPRIRRIAYIILAVLIPAVLLIAIFNFIQYEQHEATKNIPVAVVNKDQPAETNGQLIDVGHQVVNTLKKDHQVKWEFVSEKTAKKQLADGDAYLEIELPKNFSENATTLMDKNPQVSLIKLHKSHRNNFLSSMVTSTVADTVQSQVKTKVQKVYSQTLLSSLKKLGNGTKQAANGTSQLNDGMVQLKNGQTEITRNLDLLSTKMVTFESGAKTLKDGVDTYTNGVDTLTAADQKLAAGLHTLQQSAEPLVSGTAQLATGSKTLASGVNQYTDGTSTLVGGLSSFNTSFGEFQPTLDNGLQQYKSALTGGVGQIQSTISANQEMIDSLPAMAQSMGQTRTDELALKSQMTQLETGLASLENLKPVLNQLSTAQSDFNSMQNQLTSMLKILSQNGDKIKASNDKAATDNQAAIDAVNGSTTMSADEKASVLSSLNATKADIASTKGSANMNTTYLSLLNSASASKLKEFSGLFDQISASGVSSEQLSNMFTLIDSVESNANHLFSETLGDDGNTNNNALLSEKNVKSISNLQTQMEQLQGGLKTLNSGIVSGANQIQSKADNGIGQLQSQGLNKLMAGGSQLTANSSALKSGASQLANGNAQLAASAPALISGVQQLVSGSDQVVAGGSKLNGASSQLRSGTSQIYDATVTAKSGADQLAAGSHQLLDGTDTAADGVGTLNKALQDGADQIGTIHAGSSNVDHLATPISNKEVGSTSETLKNTFAPLMLALVLFLGAVATQLGLFTPDRKKRHTLFQEPLLAIGLTAVGQAVLADILLAILGVNVESWFGLGFFSLIVSVLFTIICMTLYHLFGRAGVLFAVILALLQIIITGQVFPNAMLSTFYQGVANVLPMTHAIRGFDALINGTNYNVLLAIIFLVIFTVVLAGISYLLDALVAKRTMVQESDGTNQK